MKAKSVAELLAFFRGFGFSHLLWQLRTADTLFTWDAMPPGFLEHYYGTQMDQPCAVGEAVRQNWQNFTFADAQRQFSHRPGAKDAENVWRAFGVSDGAVFYSGWGEERSMLGLCTSADAMTILEGREPQFIVAAWKLNQLLIGDPGLMPIPRALVQLSPKQLEVLRVQIENPELTLPQQASLLGISRRMLEKRHSQIAGRFGVSSFTSAVMIALKG